jgi:hypothetical protein
MGDRTHLRREGDITEPESRMKSFREARVQRSFERPSLSTQAEPSLNYQLRTTMLPWSRALSPKREPTWARHQRPRALDGCFREARRQMGDRPLPLFLGEDSELETGARSLNQNRAFSRLSAAAPNDLPKLKNFPAANRWFGSRGE